MRPLNRKGRRSTSYRGADTVVNPLNNRDWRLFDDWVYITTGYHEYDDDSKKRKPSAYRYNFIRFKKDT